MGLLAPPTPAAAPLPRSPPPLRLSPLPGQYSGLLPRAAWRGLQRSRTAEPGACPVCPEQPSAMLRRGATCPRGGGFLGHSPPGSPVSCAPRSVPAVHTESKKGTQNFCHTRPGWWDHRGPTDKTAWPFTKHELWASQPVSLHLTFLICKMGLIMLTLRSCL